MPMDFPGQRSKIKIYSLLKTSCYQWSLLCKFGDELDESLGDRARGFLAERPKDRNLEEIILKS